MGLYIGSRRWNEPAPTGYSYIDKKSGYVYVKIPFHFRSNNSGYVFEHIVVMEKQLGRQLTRNEIVHHKDGNPSNNNPDNLELMKSQSVHAMRHAAERRKEIEKRICSSCGGNRTYVYNRISNRQNYAQWYRSKLTGNWLCVNCYVYECGTPNRLRRVEMRMEMLKRVCFNCGSNKTYMNKGTGRLRWYRHRANTGQWICNNCYQRERIAIKHSSC